MNEELCRFCKRPLDDPNDPTTESCGGDCLKCMAEIVQDPDCVVGMQNIRIAALIAAGDKLAGFAGHDYICPTQQWGRWAEPCDCGYTEAAKAWEELTK